MIGKRLLAAVLGVGAVAACGGGSGSTPHASSPRQAVLTAASNTETQSFRMDGTAEESFTGSADLSGLPLLGQGITLSMHFDVESPRRSSGTVTTTIIGTPVKVDATSYDGTVYVSTNGGQSYQTAPVGSPSTQYSPDSALEYLQAVGNVSDEGPGTVDGVAVERYHAQIDPTKVGNALRSSLGASTPALQQALNALQLQSGSLDVTIDHQGRLVTEDGSMEVTVNPAAVQPSAQSSTIGISLKLTTHFSDYGAHIVVTKPSNATS